MNNKEGIKLLLKIRKEVIPVNYLLSEELNIF